MTASPPDPRQLPFLLELLDDGSPVVRREVEMALAAFGPGLRAALARLPRPPGPREVGRIEERLAARARRWLRRTWPSWYRLPGTARRLEAGLSILAAHVGGLRPRASLSSLLDGLACGFRACGRPGDAHSLSEYLFGTLGFTGAREDYGAPGQSDLIQVIETRRGLPISLACVYLLVADRLGLAVAGCQFPHHFLASFVENGELHLVDGFHGGAIQTARDLLARHPGGGAALETLVRMEASPESILGRVLRNLAVAFHCAGRSAEARLMRVLLRDLEEEPLRRHRRRQHRRQGRPRRPTRFRAGDLVRYRSGGRRGVVVACHAACRADASWYQARQGQPARDQPWYYVLLDGGQASDYAAESSLRRDAEPQPVRNPLVPFFFEGFHRGAYLRNSLAWPHPAPTRDD